MGDAVWRLGDAGFEQIAVSPRPQGSLAGVGIDPRGRRLLWMVDDGDTWAFPLPDPEIPLDALLAKRAAKKPVAK